MRFPHHIAKGSVTATYNTYTLQPLQALYLYTLTINPDEKNVNPIQKQQDLINYLLNYKAL